MVLKQWGIRAKFLGTRAKLKAVKNASFFFLHAVLRSLICLKYDSQEEEDYSMNTSLIPLCRVRVSPI
jgi:hypothetical protein